MVFKFCGNFTKEKGERMLEEIRKLEEKTELLLEINHVQHDLIEEMRK